MSNLKTPIKIVNPFKKEDVLDALQNMYLQSDDSIYKNVHSWLKDSTMVNIYKENGEVCDNNQREMVDWDYPCTPSEYKDFKNKTIVIVVNKRKFKSFMIGLFFEETTRPEIYDTLLKGIGFLDNYKSLEYIKNLLDCCSITFNNLVYLNGIAVEQYIGNMGFRKEISYLSINICRKCIPILKNENGSYSIIINPYLIRGSTIDLGKVPSPINLEEATEKYYEEKYKKLKKRYNKLKSKGN